MGYPKVEIQDGFLRLGNNVTYRLIGAILHHNLGSKSGHYSCYTCLDACTNTTVCKHMHMKSKPNNTSSPEVQQLHYIESLATTSFPLSMPQSESNLVIKKEWLIFKIIAMTALISI